ncbi:KinB sensor domain-containing domain, partial [Pseudomonas cichorii]
MKLAMKLRTRLFLSISALMTVALLGLLLGLVSVMQMAKSQEALIQGNISNLELGLKLRQNLGDQLVIMISPSPDKRVLKTYQDEFHTLLAEGIERDAQNMVQGRFENTSRYYQRFIEASQRFADDTRAMHENPELRDSFDALRNDLLDTHGEALQNISTAEAYSRERALWIAGLLGLVGIAVLCVGFITAHGIAHRFGAPIEALAKA